MPAACHDLKTDPNWEEPCSQKSEAVKPKQVSSNPSTTGPAMLRISASEINTNSARACEGTLSFSGVFSDLFSRQISADRTQQGDAP